MGSPDCIFFLLQEMREKKQKSLEMFLSFFVFLSFQEVYDTLDLENSMYSQYLINRTVGSKKSAQIYFGRYIIIISDSIFFLLQEMKEKKQKSLKNILKCF